MTTCVNIMAIQLSTEEIQNRVLELAQRLAVPTDSYLLKQLELDDTEKMKLTIDGLTLAFISYCYHKHPRGENVYEVMEQLETVAEGSPAAAALETRAEAAAALEIPFIVKLNDIVEDYFLLRRELENLIEDLSV
jgi:hypothetical protein